MSGDKPIPETALDVAERIFDATDGCACDDCRDKAAEMIRAALMAERERDAKICEQQAQEFLSAEYAANQPIGSICERFACDACATAIRNGG